MVLVQMVDDSKNGLKCIIFYWKHLFMDHTGYVIQTVVSNILKDRLLDYQKYLRKDMILF